MELLNFSSTGFESSHGVATRASKTIAIADSGLAGSFGGAVAFTATAELTVVGDALTDVGTFLATGAFLLARIRLDTDRIRSRRRELILEHAAFANTLGAELSAEGVSTWLADPVGVSFVSWLADLTFARRRRSGRPGHPRLAKISVRAHFTDPILVTAAAARLVFAISAA